MSQTVEAVASELQGDLNAREKKVDAKSRFMIGIVEILEDMTQDWDTDLDEPINESTRIIADLGFESIDVVQFITAIEEHFNCRSIPFEKLVMHDGRYVDEISVARVIEFLATHTTL